MARVVLVLCLGTATKLGAATISFNDLGPSCSTGIPANYQGLNWSSNFQVECNADYASSYGNSYGAASGYAATNGGAILSGLSEISAIGGTFDFLSAEFSTFAGSDSFQSYSAESLVIYGFRPGDVPDNPTFTKYVDLEPAAYVLHALNFTGIDRLILGPAPDPRRT